jgi:acetyl-CoA synthetase
LQEDYLSGDKMSSLLDKFVSQANFKSYSDFKSNFNIEIPKNFNFAYDVVDEYARIEPDKVAMVWCNDETDRTFTFKELKEYSDRAANFFKQQGIKKGDRVMLTLKSRYEFWFCILALHKLGAITIPATHMLKTKDIVYRVEKAGIKMVVCIAEDGVPEFFDEANRQLEGTELLKVIVGEHDREGWMNFRKEIENTSKKFERPTGAAGTKNDEVMLVYFSSGTTGMPKMIMHDHTYPFGHIITSHWQNVMDEGLHYTVADTGWAKAMWGQIYGQWFLGSKVFVYDYDRFDAGKMLEKLTYHGVTTFCAPPTIYRFLIQEDISGYDFSKLKYAVTAGEPLNPEVYNRFYELTGLKLMEGYGQTECVVCIANFPWMEPRPGSMGKPCPKYDILLMNDEGNLCDVGEEGEIVIKTSEAKPPGLFQGYYTEEKRTEKVWHDGYYHTGDTAWMDEDGYYWFVGRNDDMIKSSGYRIGPFEVESAVISHPSVLECAITGVPHSVRGQVVKATIVLTNNYKASDELAKEIQDHVKQVTAPYKYPRVIEFVEELPKTISGKIRRVEIREKDQGQ